MSSYRERLCLPVETIFIVLVCAAEGAFFLNCVATWKLTNPTDASLELAIPRNFITVLIQMYHHYLPKSEPP